MLKCIRPILALLSLAFAAVGALALSPSAVTGADALPAYVILLDSRAAVDSFKPLPDSIFNRIAGRTIFRVNRTELNTRDPFVHELTERVFPTANANEWMLMGIDLRGAASPEGPYANNVRLSKGRAKALTDWMKSGLDSVNLDNAVTTTVAEDYPYLLYLLEQDGDGAAPLLRKLIETHTMERPDLIKRDLQKANGGAVWKRLLRDYFPTVRAARIVLIFRPVHLPAFEPVGAPEPEPLAITPIESALPEIPYCATIERRHALAISTNILYDAFYMPNFGWAPMPNINLEFFPRRGNWTYRAQFMWPYYHKWSKHKFFQIRDYHLEVRRYFNPGFYHTGLYAAAYINGNIYGIGFNARKGWEGEGFGGALKIGYVLPLGKGSRWRLDFHAAVGGYYTRFDPYVWGNPITGEIDGDYYYDWTGGSHSFHKRNHRLTWFGPTEVGVTISYDFLFWRSKSGASFRRKEVLWP